MSVDLKICYDANKGTIGDIEVSTDGVVQQSTGKEEIVQRCRTRLLKQLGEWKFNLASGMPWMETDKADGILGGVGSESYAEQEITTILQNTDGVIGVNVVDAQFLGSTREYKIQIDIDTIYGNANITL